ncbi:MAG: hypothetical protein GY926_12060 [bacterium]|nr:hypothetical protein [bacterium]
MARRAFVTDRDGQAVADQVTLHLTVGGRVSACPTRAITPVTAVVTAGFWSADTE